MLIFTVDTYRHFTAGPRIRFRKRISAPFARVLLPALILASIACAACPAAAVEFVTEKAFNVEKSNYKAYPYRVLFQKFQASTGAEKRKIRNFIILKQVFDPEIRQRAIAAGAKFEAFYGVVKSVTAESLRLWLPESDSFRDFTVGIGRIPVENRHDYPAAADNIGDFAAIVHVLDGRVYKIDISFALPPPENLEVRRRGEHNVVSWQPVQNAAAPTGYHVFVNGKRYKTVTGTSVAIPRSRDQADEFYVKAVYTHQKGRVASAPSATLYDAASAREIEKRRQAGDAYQRIADALGRADQPAARKLLDANQQLLTGFLNPEHKAHVLALGACFAALDEGDRLTALQPETPENAAGARAAYQRAADEASRLPADFKLTAVAGSRLAENTTLNARLTARLQREKAGQALARISADLKPGRWEQARRHFYQQQAFLGQHLDPENRAGVQVLADVFQAIEKGDVSAGIQPPAPRHLEAAMASYRQAEKISRTLPASLDAGFIARQRIKTTANRQASLAAEERIRAAGRTWDRLVVALNPSEWPRAKTSLYENRASLAAHLPAQDKAAMATLVAFFTSLDEGDRQAAVRPATAESLDTAARYYQRAARKAETLPHNLDVGFITQIKSAEIKKMRARLQADMRKQESAQAFDQITTALDTGQWREARSLLYARQALLTRHLDARRKTDSLTLIGFFRDIDEGDRLAGVRPATGPTLDSALESYRRAVAKAQALPSSLDVGLIARQKIRALVARKDQLARGEQDARARRVYDRILAALTPAHWETARAVLAENDTLLTTQLDPARQATAAKLTAFFQFVADGDRLCRQQPVTPDNLNMALSAYRLADQKARGLADVIDLSFLVDLKMGSASQQRSALEASARRKHARGVYREILATLNPDGWETGMRLALDKLPSVTEDLTGGTRSDARLLVAFFKDIEAGDRLSFKRPETDGNLSQARGRYLQAEKKAESRAGSPEVLFIARARLNTLTAQRAELVKREQARMAARQVPAPPPASVKASPPPAPAPAVSPAAAFDGRVDNKAALKLGMKSFSAQDYDLSLKYFNIVYARQIGKLKKTGKKQSFAVLSVPPRVRAEIIFLVQLDLLKKRADGDEDAVRDGLMDMQDDVESSSGPWSIIKERKRSKILKHIERYPF